MKRVMVFGTFDIFHPGHRSLLKQSKKFGNYLIVVVARDKTVGIIKKQKPMNKETTRVKIIKNSKLADKVIFGSLTDKYASIKKYRPDTICLGYDQKHFIDGLREELERLNLEKTKIIRTKPYKPEIYKTSKLKANFSL
jgi:FAD synthetase